MNHGCFVSLLWKGFRALALIPEEWACGLLCAFGHQRAGNGRDGTPHPQVELREKANPNPSLSRQSTFLTSCTVWSCTSCHWQPAVGFWEVLKTQQLPSPSPNTLHGKLWCNPAWERLWGGKGRGEEHGMCTGEGMQSRAAQRSASDGPEHPWRFWGAADPEWRRGTVECLAVRKLPLICLTVGKRLPERCGAGGGEKPALGESWEMVSAGSAGHTNPLLLQTEWKASFTEALPHLPSPGVPSPLFPCPHCSYHSSSFQSCFFRDDFVVFLTFGSPFPMFCMH